MNWWRQRPGQFTLTEPTSGAVRAGDVSSPRSRVSLLVPVMDVAVEQHAG